MGKLVKDDSLPWGGEKVLKVQGLVSTLCFGINDNVVTPHPQQMQSRPGCSTSQSEGFSPLSPVGWELLPKCSHTSIATTFSAFEYEKESPIK